MSTTAADVAHLYRHTHTQTQTHAWVALKSSSFSFFFSLFYFYYFAFAPLVVIFSVYTKETVEFFGLGPVCRSKGKTSFHLRVVNLIE